MLKPFPGETKEAYILRFMANKNTTDEEATLAWEEITTSHTGDSSTPCCKGRTLDHVSFQVNLATYSIKIKKFEGRDHIVVPAVLLTEGVHNGSGGAIYYSAAEIAKFPGAWNGVPVPVFHPEAGGFPISCNSPEVLESQNVGRVFGAMAVEGGKKLKAEVWLDVVRLQAIDPELLAKINSKQTIEVSTGLFMEEEETPGEWNGEKYASIAKNFRPDHLALLPVGVGACSTADGCGIRANQVFPNYQALYERLVTHANPSYNEVMRMIRTQVLSPMEISSPVKGMSSVYFYLKEVWADYFIYEKESGSMAQLFKQKYKMSSDKTKIELEGVAMEVVESTTFKEVKNMKQSQGGKKVNREQMIEYLTANGFAPDEKSWEGMTDDALSMTVKAVEENVTTKLSLEASQKEVETLKANEKKAPNTPEEFIAQAPAEIQVTLNRAMARDRQMKKDLVERLTKNQKVFTNAELEVKTLDELEKLAELALPKDFSLRGGRTAATTNEEEPMGSPVLNFAKK